MITEGYLARHSQGRRGGRDVALLDVAQDYALKLLFDAGLFELGLTFKGGTALRKYRAGSTGRFSTDLDYAVEDPDLGEMVMETLDEAEPYDVAFSVEVVTPGRRGGCTSRPHSAAPRSTPSSTSAGAAYSLRQKSENRYHFPSIEDTNSSQSLSR